MRGDPPPPGVERLRSSGSQVLGWTMVGGGLLALLSLLVSLVLTGDSRPLGVAGGVCALFALAGWLVFCQPHVEVSDGGVRLANVTRTVDLPWPAIREVQGRYGLRLVTAYGGHTAWAATPPSGRARARGEAGPTAQAVSRRLEALREAGHLDDARYGGRLEAPRPEVRWHVAELAALAALALVSVALPLLL